MKNSTSLTAEQKDKLKDILVISHMLTEESASDVDENGDMVMIIRPPTWRSEEARSAMQSLDRKADRRKSVRAREMSSKRKEGAPSERPCPEGPEWAITS